MQRLREAAEKAKCELSSSTQTEIILPNIFVESIGAKHIYIKLSRSKFEELIDNLIKRTIEPFKQTIQHVENYKRYGLFLFFPANFK